MKFTSSFPQKKLLCAAISFSLLQISGGSIAQEAEVEEVVVTGSFIRRTEGFRAASPVTQITADDIAAAGTPNMGDVIANMRDRKSTRLNSSHVKISYAVFCLKKKIK